MVRLISAVCGSTVAMFRDFGVLLRAHRLSAGLTQEELAEASEDSARTVSLLETRRQDAPRLASARLLGRHELVRDYARTLAMETEPPDSRAAAVPGCSSTRSARRVRRRTCHARTVRLAGRGAEHTPDDCRVA